MHGSRLLLLLLAGALVTAVAAAEDFAVVANPYQAEFPFAIDAELRPAVEVDGIRWLSLRVTPKDADDVRSGEQTTAFVTFELENRRDEGATAIVIALLEDEQGNGLDRVECEPVEVPGASAKSFRYKTKIQGDVLLATKKIYLFLEARR